MSDHGSNLPPSGTSGSFGKHGRQGGSGPGPSGTAYQPGPSNSQNPSQLFNFPNASRGSEGRTDGFASETVEKAETVVEDVRRRNLHKGLAIGRLFSIFDLDGDHSESERDKRQRGFENFVDQIEEEERIQKASAREGKRVEKALAYRPDPRKRNSRSRSPESNRNGLPGGSGGRRRSISPYGEPDPAISGGKRVRIRREQLPWAAKDDEFIVNTSDSSCLRNQELLRIFKLDVSWTLADIELSPTAPSGFPETEWRHILEGKAVNLNTVLGHLHFREAPEPDSARMGEHEITLISAKGSTKVTNAAQWTSAWDAASDAYEFVFEHRRHELREYGNQIRRMFAARLPQSAPRVIAYDEAVRKLVKGATAMRLSDFHRFNYLADAHLSYDGIEAQRREGKGKVAGYGGGFGGDGRATGLCDRYNQKGGCERADGKCRFRHVCRKCGKPGHGETSCKGAGSKET